MSIAQGFLFKIKDGKISNFDKLFVSAKDYHPDSPRLIVISESPCKENGFKPATVLARYIEGEYHGVTTGNILPLLITNSKWTESSVAEGPFSVVVGEKFEEYNKELYPDLQHIYKVVQELNMGSMGNPVYHVVNQQGILVGHDGHLYI